MNWKKFKEYVESKGIKDETVISYIDWVYTEIPTVEIYSDGSGAYIE